MFAWIRRLFRRGKSPELDHALVIPMSRELHRLFEVAADQEGLTLQVWSRRVLSRGVPAAALRRIQSSALSKAGVEAAFDLLDQEDPQPLPSPGRRLRIVPSDQHPCSHLLPEIPKGFARKDVQGTCGTQHGRPCHWAGAVASQCAYFKSRGLEEVS